MRLDDASPLPLWLDRPRPAEAPPLEGEVDADLAIVGAGFTGLWAALQAKYGRILFGGYEAVYRFSNRIDDGRLSRDPATHELLDRVGLGFDS